MYKLNPELEAFTHYKSLPMDERLCANISEIVMVLKIGVWGLDLRKLFDLEPSKMSKMSF